MTGFNHYADCACGWCVNYGRTRLDHRQVREGLRQRDALTFLQRNSANSIAGCYLNPNARCPVCNSPVFFYANQFGSRVYFDDLGPPWPKHPCTDKPRQRIELGMEQTLASARRPRGLVQELITSANIAGLFRRKVFGQRSPAEWALLIITSVERRGVQNYVKAEFLDSLNGEAVQFKCSSSMPVFKVGDFVSKKGNDISFLHQDTLLPILFQVGSSIIVPSTKPPQELVSPPIRSKHSQETHQAPAGRKRSSSKRNVDYSKFKPTVFDLAHYHTESVAQKGFCEKMRPIVRKYAREGTRKPRDVAIRLNFDGHKTARGARWTPRLTHFLLGLLFQPATGKRHRATGLNAANVPAADSNPKSRNRLTSEETAKRRRATLRQAILETRGK